MWCLHYVSEAPYSWQRTPFFIQHFTYSLFNLFFKKGLSFDTNVNFHLKNMFWGENGAKCERSKSYDRYYYQSCCTSILENARLCDKYSHAVHVPYSLFLSDELKGYLEILWSDSEVHFSPRILILLHFQKGVSYSVSQNKVSPSEKNIKNTSHNFRIIFHLWHKHYMYCLSPVQIPSRLTF